MMIAAVPLGFCVLFTLLFWMFSSILLSTPI